ncbi:MAG: septum site-determining protein MinC [Anaerolineales bacterium]|nr:septum site-determining protein MinC [Anaerolineales bacterium]
MDHVTTPIQIKGIRDGLLVTMGNGALDETFQALEAELQQKADFLQGSRIVLDVGERPLRKEQLADIQDVFARHRLVLWTVLADREMTRSAARELELAIRLPGSHTDLDGNLLAASQAPPRPEKADAPADGLFLKETLRSGRSVFHEGSVVVIGDVNPGAEVIAGGDVVVWGRLRGLVHAGALGDQTAVICALDLSPTQLRIADQIAIPPDSRGRRPEPEQAAIRQGQIVAEPWPTRL